MSGHVVIDGNNLLFAMHASGLLPNIGREKLLRIVERWSRGHGDKVTLYFDGPTPRGGLAKQMSSTRIHVRFSNAETADDCIIRMIANARYPTGLRVVTTDSVIAHEARYRKCAWITSELFVGELIPGEASGPQRETRSVREKPGELSAAELDSWLTEFDLEDDEDEPFDGFEAMRGADPI